MPALGYVYLQAKRLFPEPEGNTLLSEVNAFSRKGHNASTRGNPAGPRLLLLAVPQELKQPDHVLVPYKYCKTA
jgi:hypothetical protein